MIDLYYFVRYLSLMVIEDLMLFLDDLIFHYLHLQHYSHEPYDYVDLKLIQQPYNRMNYPFDRVTNQIKQNINSNQNLNSFDIYLTLVSLIVAIPIESPSGRHVIRLENIEMKLSFNSFLD